MGFLVSWPARFTRGSATAGFDFGNKTDLGRLHKAIKTSDDAMGDFRAARTEFVGDYVGSWYSAKKSGRLAYVNRMNQSGRIAMMALAFNNPQVRITSFNPAFWPECRKKQVNINRVLTSIDFKTTFQAGLLDAFFLMGIFKVYRAEAGRSELDDNVWIDPGMPWFSRVSLDDVVIDMAAKDIRALRFVTDRYRVAWWKVEERAKDDFDRKTVAKMSPSSKQSAGDGGDRASEIATGSTVDDDELEPMVWLRTVYVPETGRAAILSLENEDLPPLKVWDDDTGPMGPYEMLGLGLVPDNVMPSSPAQNLKPLHDLINTIYRKLAHQAKIQKNIVGTPDGSEDDLAKAKGAKNGEYVIFRDPKQLVPINFPGPDPGLNAFFVAAQEVYNEISGNERALAGLGQEAGTLGQEEIIQNKALGLMMQLKGSVVDCAGRICRKIGALMHDDEALSLDTWDDVEQTGYPVPSHWRPGERLGVKEDYEYSIEPNSMAYRPPEVKLQSILEYCQAVSMLMPLVQAGLLDLQALTRLAAECRNIPELMQIFRLGPQTADQGGALGANEATKPPVTSREVVRRNLSQGPRGNGMAAVMSQIMQSAGRNAGGVTVGGRG